MWGRSINATPADPDCVTFQTVQSGIEAVRSRPGRARTSRRGSTAAVLVALFTSEPLLRHIADGWEIRGRAEHQPRRMPSLFASNRDILDRQGMLTGWEATSREINQFLVGSCIEAESAVRKRVGCE